MRQHIVPNNGRLRSERIWAPSLRSFSPSYYEEQTRQLRDTIAQSLKDTAVVPDDNRYVAIYLADTDRPAVWMMSL
ncbi:MAG: hypothetical protein GWO08_07835 [Gammaproteobacteria bacterium]|nr:hypothetical protein [Gammaproteobacteria bacterium]NIR93575.1 hypothetical protein [Gammaproteobacteria bacterium]